MNGFEHKVKGTVVVNSSDPSVKSDARFIVAKVVDGEVWFEMSTDDEDKARRIVAESTYVPMFLIDRKPA